MPKKKYPYEFTDARGNTVIHYKDGRSEMYIGGRALASKWLDVSDKADTEVNRKRFLPDMTAPHVPLQTRDDDSMPGIDDLDDENADEID